MNESNEPDLRELFARYWAGGRRALRHYPVVLVALLLGLSSFALFSHFHAPKYRSDTVVLYATQAPSDDDAVESSGEERSVAVRLRELLFARPSLEQVVRGHQLYPELRRRFGMVEAVEELKKHIEFKAPGGDTFSIAFEGSSASEAQRVTQRLAQLVIDGDTQLRKDQARLALEFLQNQKRDTESQLREAEERLAAFMAKHPRFALDATPLANGAAIRASLAASAARPTATRGWVARPRSSTPASAPAEGALRTAAPAPTTDAEEARARAAVAAAREHLNEQLTRFTPAHPDVRAAEAELSRATQRLASLASAAPARPAPAAAPADAAPAPSTAPVVREPPVRRAPAPVAAAPRSAPPSEQAQSMVDLETEWLQLTRAVTEVRQRQEQLETRLFRADMQAGSAALGHGVQVKVIDPAYLPEKPLPPGRTTLAALFVGGAGALGALLALLLGLLDDRVFVPRDLTGVAPLLVEVPRLPTRRTHARA